MYSKKITNNSWFFKKDQAAGLVTKQPDNRFSVFFGGVKKQFSTPEDLTTYLSFDIFRQKRKPEPLTVKKEAFVMGFPVKVSSPCEVAKEIADQNPGLPLFKKSEHSRAVFVAGYFAVQMTTGWQNVFCPKLSTVKKRNCLGPYKTTQEVNTLIPKLSNEKHPRAITTSSDSEK